MKPPVPRFLPAEFPRLRHETCSNSLGDSWNHCHCPERAKSATGSQMVPLSFDLGRRTATRWCQNCSQDQVGLADAAMPPGLKTAWPGGVTGLFLLLWIHIPTFHAVTLFGLDAPSRDHVVVISRLSCRLDGAISSGSFRKNCWAPTRFSGAGLPWCWWRISHRDPHSHEALVRPGASPARKLIRLYDSVKPANACCFSHSLLKLLSVPNFTSLLNVLSWQVAIERPGPASRACSLGGSTVPCAWFKCFAIIKILNHFKKRTLIFMCIGSQKLHSWFEESPWAFLEPVKGKVELGIIWI